MVRKIYYVIYSDNVTFISLSFPVESTIISHISHTTSKLLLFTHRGPLITDEFLLSHSIQHMFLQFFHW